MNKKPKKQEVVKTKWVCPHCQKEFMREGSFFNHVETCDMKRRIDASKTLIGSIAFDAYNYWMRKTRKGEQSIQTFIKSKRSYTSLMKFAEFYTKTSIGPMEPYIDFMVENEINFCLWSNHNVYAKYVNNYDNIHQPAEQWLASKEVIDSMCVEYNTNIVDIYNVIDFDVLTRLILKRKLSPWYLMASPSFKAWLMRLDRYKSDVINSALQVPVFIQTIRANSNLFGELAKETEVFENSVVKQGSKTC